MACQQNGLAQDWVIGCVINMQMGVEDVCDLFQPDPPCSKTRGKLGPSSWPPGIDQDEQVPFAQKGDCSLGWTSFQEDINLPMVVGLH